jgi:hypothetical protein
MRKGQTSKIHHSLKLPISKILSRKKLNTELSQDLAIPLLGICPQDSKSQTQDTCTAMFISSIIHDSQKGEETQVFAQK